MISTKTMVIIFIGLIISCCTLFILRSSKAPRSRGAQSTAELLQEYIKINTAQPNPDYRNAIAFLKRLAAEDDLPSHEVTLPSGKSALIITLLGSDSSLPALALHHHMDVVAANPAEWHHHPFDGIIEKGTIYGRGAQDMKGVAICHYQALREIKKEGIQLRRTVYCIAVPDEEIGGFAGAGQLVQTNAFETLHIGYMIDEGLPSSDPSIIYIKTTERKPLQVKFSITGKTAHGSQLHCHNVLHTMIDFLSQLTRFQYAQQQKAMHQDPGLFLSINITSCHAGELPSSTNKAAGVNIVPSSATATADIRVPAGMPQAEAKQLLADFMQQYPEINYQILAEVQDYHANDVTKTSLYRCIEESIKDQGIYPKELHFQATTDLRHYLPSIEAGCGISPFTVNDNLHGIDESITIDELTRGTTIIKQIIMSFCR
jgi:aminoacylase